MASASLSETLRSADSRGGWLSRPGLRRSPCWGNHTRQIWLLRASVPPGRRKSQSSVKSEQNLGAQKTRVRVSRRLHYPGFPSSQGHLNAVAWMLWCRESLKSPARLGLDLARHAAWFLPALFPSPLCSLPSLGDNRLSPLPATASHPCTCSGHLA